MCDLYFVIWRNAFQLIMLHLPSHTMWYYNRSINTHLTIHSHAIWLDDIHIICNIFQKIEEIPSASNIRSCLCFVSDYIPFNSLQLLFQCFKLLRVLDMSLIDFTVYPSEIEQLVLLRYLSLDYMWTHLAGDVSLR